MQNLITSKFTQKGYIQTLVNYNNSSLNNKIGSVFQKRLKTDALIISAYKDKKDFKINLTNTLKSESAQKELNRRLKASHFEGKKFEMRSLFGFSDINKELPDIIQVVGLGEKNKVNADINRRAVSLNDF